MAIGYPTRASSDEVIGSGCVCIVCKKTKTITFAAHRLWVVSNPVACSYGSHACE